MPSKPTPENELLSRLREIADQVALLPETLPASKAGQARVQLLEVVKGLGRVLVELDPVREPTMVFDPSDPQVVGRFIGLALVAQERIPLGEVRKFYGAGVYALYYNGPFGAYAPLVGSENPIYVGKADPADSSAKTPREQDQRLARRLADHARAIRKAEAHGAKTLSLADFHCRYLVVQSGYQTAAENYLIHLFKPIWNDEIRICYGLGKHGDDPSTRANLRSPWDTMHPGRDWAHRDPSIRDAKASGLIMREIEEHFGKYPPYGTVEDVLRNFFEELRQR